MEVDGAGEEAVGVDDEDEDEDEESEYLMWRSTHPLHPY